MKSKLTKYKVLVRRELRYTSYKTITVRAKNKRAARLAAVMRAPNHRIWIDQPPTQIHFIHHVREA